MHNVFQPFDDTSDGDAPRILQPWASHNQTTPHRSRADHSDPDMTREAQHPHEMFR
jgi:hypothetical protein